MRRRTTVVVSAYFVAAVVVTRMTSVSATGETWTPTASMSVGRYFHSASLLRDGRVLIVGGLDGTSARGDAEIYDPSANTWRAAPPTSAARYAHTATVLADGRVLVTGGTDAGNQYLAHSQVFDPSTNSWSPVIDMQYPRTYHTATLLADGRVLVTGGYTPNANPYDVYTPTAEIFDPAANTWTLVASMTVHRVGHVAEKLADGRILVAGGANYAKYEETAEIYDPSTNVWTGVPSMRTQRYGAAASLLADGRVMVAGGSFFAAQASVEFYDPAGNRWDLAPSMSVARSFFNATRLSDGTILVEGGWNGSAIPSSEIFDPMRAAWSSTSQMHAARYKPTATILRDGRVLVTGGSDGASPVPTTDVWGVPLPIVDAGPDQTVTVNNVGIGTITLSGTASSPAGFTPLTYAWSDGTAQVGTAASVTLQRGLGIYTFTLTVTDSKGMRASAQVKVMVQLPAAVHLTGDNTFAGNQTVNGTVTATTFMGDGSGLANVTAAYATSAGTAKFAATAETAANASALGGVPPSGSAIPNTIAARDSVGDLFANVFHGSGAALTNIPSTALPNNVAYKDQANSFSGTQTVNGQLVLPALTSAAGKLSASQALNLQGWDGTNPTAFQWLVTSGGKLNLQTATGGNPVVDSGLTIASDGTISFAPRQSFPGIQNALSAGSGIALNGNTIANTGALSFNGRSGPVTPATNDYSFGQIAGTLGRNQATGTYDIGISGNASTASFATSAASADFATSAASATNASALSGALPSTTVTPNTIVARDAIGDLFANVFHGSGAALTSIPSAALPNNVAYKDQANSFSGMQTINGQLLLPAVTNAAGTPAASQALNLQGWDGANPTAFQWQVTSAGKLGLQTATGGNPAADTSLTIASDGSISFVPGQAFPGTQQPLTAGAGIAIANNAVSNTGVLALTPGNNGIVVGGSSSNPTISNAGVLSFNGRSGPVIPTASDYSFSQIGGTFGPTQAGPGTYPISVSGTAANASTLNGLAQSTGANLNTIAARDGSGNLSANTFVGVGVSVGNNANVTGITTTGKLIANTSIAIDGGTPILGHLSSSVVVSFSVVVAGTKVCLLTPDIPISGAADGDTVALTASKATMTQGGGALQYSAWVSGSNTITIRVCSFDPNVILKVTNPPMNGTFRIDVWKH